MFTSLFTIAASINHSFQQENFRMAGGDMHASIKNITWEQVEQLRADPLVKEGGARLFLGMPEEEPFNKSHVEVSYIEPQLASHYFCVPVEGSLPREGTDEAATDTRVLGLLGVEPKVGEQFTVTYNLGVGTGNPKQVTQTFTLSGWWEYDEAVTASNILLPQSRAEEALEGYQNQGRYDMTGRWTLDVMFASSLHIESDLTELLENKYGYNVIHNTSVFDMIDGVLDRNTAYNLAETEISSILAANPTVEVVIDLHRDGLDGEKLVTQIDGKQVAKIMFFNGLSRTARNGNVDYLPNPYIEENLAFSFQLQIKAQEYYPGFTRHIYLQSLRYNLHLKPRALLIEAGSQLNTVEEEKNAMEPLADILDRVLAGR